MHSLLKLNANTYFAPGTVISSCVFMGINPAVLAAIIINLCCPVLYDIQKQAQNIGPEFQGLKLTSKVRSCIWKANLLKYWVFISKLFCANWDGKNTFKQLCTKIMAWYRSCVWKQLSHFNKSFCNVILPAKISAHVKQPLSACHFS